MKKILIIDDEREVGEFIAAAATNLGLQTEVSTDANELERLLTPEVDLIVLD